MVSGRKSPGGSSKTQPVCCLMYPPCSVPPLAPLSLSPRSLTLPRLPFLLCLNLPFWVGPECFLTSQPVQSPSHFSQTVGKSAKICPFSILLPSYWSLPPYRFHCIEVTRDFSVVEVDRGTESGEFLSCGAYLFQPLLHMYHAMALPGALHGPGRAHSGDALVCASNAPVHWLNNGN